MESAAMPAAAGEKQETKKEDRIETLREKARERLFWSGETPVNKSGFYLPTYIYPDVEIERSYDYEIVQELCDKEYQSRKAYAFDPKTSALYLVREKLDRYGEYYDDLSEDEIPPSDPVYKKIKEMHDKDMAVLTARNELADALSGGDALLRKIISLSIAKDGEVQIMRMRGIEFFAVGENSSHRFYLGVKDGKLFRYATTGDEVFIEDQIAVAQEEIDATVEQAELLARMDDREFEAYVTTKQQAQTERLAGYNHQDNERFLPQTIKQIQQEKQMAEYLLTHNPKNTLQLDRIVKLIRALAAHVNEPDARAELAAVTNEPEKVDFTALLETHADEPDDQILAAARKCIKKCLPKVKTAEQITKLAEEYLTRNTFSNFGKVEDPAQTQNRLQELRVGLEHLRVEGEMYLQMTPEEKAEHISGAAAAKVDRFIDRIKSDLRSRFYAGDDYESIDFDQPVDPVTEQMVEHFIRPGSAIHEIDVNQEEEIYIDRGTFLNLKDLTITDPRELWAEAIEIATAKMERSELPDDELN